MGSTYCYDDLTPIISLSPSGIMHKKICKVGGADFCDYTKIHMILGLERLKPEPIVMKFCELSKNYKDHIKTDKQLLKTFYKQSHLYLKAISFAAYDLYMNF